MLSRVATSTKDLGLVAYLMLMGARFEGVQTEAFPATFTLSHRRMDRVLRDWNANKPIRFAPRAFCEMRQQMKKYLPPRKA